MRSFILFTAAIAIAAPLQAAPVMQSITASVDIADLNLASSSGQRVLSHRIASAVEQVCGSYANAREQYEQMRVDACRAAAMADAHRQIASKSTVLRLAAADAR
jgi:UrcA family protein